MCRLQKCPHLVLQKAKSPHAHVQSRIDALNQERVGVLASSKRDRRCASHVSTSRQSRTRLRYTSKCSIEGPRLLRAPIRVGPNLMPTPFRHATTIRLHESMVVILDKPLQQIAMTLSWMLMPRFEVSGVLLSP